MYTLYIFVCSRCGEVSNYMDSFVCYCPVCDRVYPASEATLLKAHLTYEEAKLLLKEVNDE